MDRRVTLPTRGPPSPCKQALNDQLSVGLLHVAQLGTSAAPVSQRAGFKSGKPEFFRLSFRNIVSCVFNCDDLFSDFVTNSYGESFMGLIL